LWFLGVALSARGTVMVVDDILLVIICE